MEIMETLFGSGKSLTAMQMGLRGVAIFIIALILLRISGRRSFGIGSPLDNIVVILLGAILSKAVVGVSPFVPVVITCTIIVLLHRAVSSLKAKSSRFNTWLEGEKITLFKDGDFIQSNMSRAQLNREDIMQELRKTVLTDDLNKISKIFIERNGEISIMKKNPDG